MAAEEAIQQSLRVEFAFFSPKAIELIGFLKSACICENLRPKFRIQGAASIFQAACSTPFTSAGLAFSAKIRRVKSLANLP